MKNMNLIINTHWDREYRWSLRETQYRLVEAVDELLDIMQRDEKFCYFHTDSQVSMLDDYLKMRPERTQEVKDLVSAGRILTGPWYTLPAEFLVNGECLVRNLLLGHQISGALGRTMKAAHNIFSWGQVSQLPQLYRQFGMDTITFYRGINQTELNTLEFRWKGADGKESLAITFGEYHRLNFWRFVYKPYILGGGRMIGNSLKNAFSRDDLGDAYLTQMCGESLAENNHWLSNQTPVRDFESAKDGLKRLIETVIHKAVTDELLFFQGFDQENPDPIITELVDRLNETLDDGRIEIASLENYISKVRDHISPQIYDALPVKSGEMLEVEKKGDPFGPLYNGVFSARMPIKLKNAQAEYELINGAEPAAAWSALLGNEYPALLLGRAWKQLLQNQQHDGIGGCHVDRVTEAMMERFRETMDISETILRKSLKQVTGEIDFSMLGAQEIGAVVYNTLPFERTGMVICTVDVPLSWNLRYANKGRREISIDVADFEGNSIPAQMLNIEDDTVYAYLKYGDTFDFDVSRCRLVMQLQDIPQNGFLALRLRPKEGEQRPVDWISPKANMLENEYLSVKINWNGTLTVTEKETGRVMEQVHFFEDSSDKGGPLVYSPVYERMTMYSLNEPASAALVYNGPLQATYRIMLRWRLPKRVEAALKVHVPHGSEWVDQGRMQRSDEWEELCITTDVTLKKGARWLQFHTVVDNTIKDHRLRVLFETGLSGAMLCRADSPFDIVQREITVPDSSQWYEAAARTWPSHSLVAVSEKEFCAAVYHKGICEYEVLDDDTRAITLTLLRCFSNAGNPTETYEYQELAECQGKSEFDYWLAVYPKKVGDADLAKAALDAVQPCYVMQTTKHCGELPGRLSFFGGKGEDFLLTSVTKGREKNQLLLRGYSLAGAESCVTLFFWKKLLRAEKVTLENCLLESLTVRDGHYVTFSAGDREIITLSLEWSEENDSEKYNS